MMELGKNQNPHKAVHQRIRKRTPACRISLRKMSSCYWCHSIIESKNKKSTTHRTQTWGEAYFGLGTFMYSFDHTCSVHHRLEMSPASPENDPAGRMVGPAVLMTAQARKRVTEVVNRPLFTLMTMTPLTQQRNVFRRNHVTRRTRLGVFAAAQVAQIQQRQSHHAQQADHRMQAIRRCELRILDPATRFLSLVEFFDDPAAFVPVHHLVCRLERFARIIRQQKPFQSLDALGRLRFALSISESSLWASHAPGFAGGNFLTRGPRKVDPTSCCKNFPTRLSIRNPSWQKLQFAAKSGCKLIDGALFVPKPKAYAQYRLH